MSTPRECRARRDALLALLDDPLGAGLEPDARDHLDACDRCRSEVGELVLAGRRVRTALAEAAIAEPPATAWPRLRARIGCRTPSLGRAASPVLGLALATSLAAALLLPLGYGPLLPVRGAPGSSVIHEAGLDPAAVAAAGRRDEAAEFARLRTNALAARVASSERPDGRAWTALIRAELVPERAPKPAAPRSLAAAVE